MVGTNKLLALDLLAPDKSLFDNLFGSFSNCLGFSLFSITSIVLQLGIILCIVVVWILIWEILQLKFPIVLVLGTLCVLSLSSSWLFSQNLMHILCLVCVTLARSWQLHWNPWESTLLLQSWPPKMPCAFCQCIMMEFACWWCILALIPWATLEPSANYLILTSRSHN
jgi:hypothetical protein